MNLKIAISIEIIDTVVSAALKLMTWRYYPTSCLVVNYLNKQYASFFYQFLNE